MRLLLCAAFVLVLAGCSDEEQGSAEKPAPPGGAAALEGILNGGVGAGAIAKTRSGDYQFAKALCQGLTLKFLAKQAGIEFTSYSELPKREIAQYFARRHPNTHSSERDQAAGCLAGLQHK